LPELDDWQAPALFGDADPIVDAELIEPEADHIGLPPGSNAEPAHSAGRRTYTIRDF
jgi:hypothetical protein